MADEQVTPEVPESTAAEVETTDDADHGEEQFDAERALTKIRKANAEAKAQRERAKAAEQKAADLETLAAQVPDLEAALLRERVGRRFNLPDALVERLRGSTEDEMVADAEKLLELVAPPRRPAGPSRPAELVTNGGQPATDGAVTPADGNAWFNNLVRQSRRNSL